ncbi:MAG: sigma-70 family RNA polymerase sigma factor [Vicinamibacteria bacterium]
MGTAGELPLEAAESLTGVAREQDLVALCRRGDPAAFARLVALHESMVFNLAARLLGDGEEARDVAQEVFLQVYRTLGRFEGRSSLKTWIYRIVVNQCHNRRRFWHRRGRDREEALDEGLAAPDRVGGGAWQASPYQQAVAGERARRVQRALLGLRFDQRTVLVLREIEGLSCEEVAGALGIPEGTVKSRLSRAREALRERLLGVIEGGEAR